ncbi:sigma-54-dependent Fis family transcriptional regulator [Arsenicitalea aurantiaca]|uniref:Sigma-54-dependent Fis family transcriptional regulator n=1 Tax=Arsenicitalea aurantiaca TaxID=1783274 RepID=A0A433X2P0_9HYPH|nr:sigma-54 dependent transcriptional regulator [Arsenicitalea aurantiaca]RUT28353.1 sigma-54-dependent Fis family transcriptional regulator [Arsenicitalea aurantiaca]
MSTRPLIGIVEDDSILGSSLEQRFLLEGYAVLWLRSAAEAEAALARTPVELVLSDIRLPDGDGETVMAAVFARYGIVPTIFMTAFGGIEQAVRLVRMGARDYLAKPFDLDALVERVAAIVPRTTPEGEAGGARPAATFGLSPGTEAVRRTLERVADLDLPVLLLGETGTGKEVAARFLHAASARAAKPFIAINCGALQAELFDSALFGHEKGAFTSAVARHVGFVEQAGEGTLFLDEIGEVEPALQVKLLRLIQEREFQRLGGRETLHCAARIVLATNRDLEAEVAAGRFREDLYFRINVLACPLPPLRARREEIAPLLAHFVAAAARRFGQAAPELGPDALEAANAHDWPGNVRELINRAERAVALAEGPVLGVGDLFPDRALGRRPAAPAEDASLASVREGAERAHIVETLRQTGGAVQAAAEKLGISRTTLWEKMRRYGIEP